MAVVRQQTVREQIRSDISTTNPAFVSDIQGRDTALVPVICIGNLTQMDDDGDVTTFIANAFFISTNSGSFSVTRYTGTHTENYLPLLLNIPSLKESIDIEKRNYKISSVNIDISNLPYDGKRFSELITNSPAPTENGGSTDGLINTECRIYWVSPSTNLIHPQDIGYNSTLTDSYNHAFQIYNGIIRRYTHDDEKVRLVVEDRSQASLHRDLPLPENWLGTDESIPSKYRNKPIPMVYGEVERSPLLFKNNYRTLVADVEDVGFSTSQDRYLSEQGAVWMDVGTHLINVQAPGQYFAANPGELELTVFEEIEEDIAGVYKVEGIGLLCRDYSTNYKASLSNSIHQPNEPSSTFEGLTPGSLQGINDGLMESNIVDWTSSAQTTGASPNGNQYGNFTTSSPRKDDIILFYDSGNGALSIDFRTIYENDAGDNQEFLLLKLNINYFPDYDHIEAYPDTNKTFPAILDGLIINENNIGDVVLPTLNDQHFPAVMIHAKQGTAHNAQGGDTISGIPVGSNFVAIDSPAYGMPDLRDVFNFPAMLANQTGGNNLTAPIQFLTPSTSNLGSGNIEIKLILMGFADIGGGYHSSAQSNITEIELRRKVTATNVFKNKFYGNIQGRTIADGTTAQRRNPADQIYDILTRELDVSGNFEYVKPGNYVSALGIKTDFTVDKSISSKKLIENIASVSSLIPRFDNMGKFRLDMLPHNGYVTTYGATGKNIKKEDVISFSYSRTKIEDVYTKIDFSYEWDYANDDFSKNIKIDFVSVDNIDTGARLSTYYGLKPDNSESTLVIDDDRGKYIRDPLSAANYANFMLWWHCNQHLIIKVRLPLKYMDIEIGGMGFFIGILGNTLPYGIDYSLPDNGTLNGQTTYPHFLVTSTNKTLEYVDIECVQLHKTPALPDSFIVDEVPTLDPGVEYTPLPMPSYEVEFTSPAYFYVPSNNFPNIFTIAKAEQDMTVGEGLGWFSLIHDDARILRVIEAYPGGNPDWVSAFSSAGYTLDTIPSTYDNWSGIAFLLGEDPKEYWWNSDDGVYVNNLTDGIFHKDKEYIFYFQSYTDDNGEGITYTVPSKWYDSFNSLQGDAIPVIWT